MFNSRRFANVVALAVVAKAEYCVFWKLGGCSTSNTYIQHTLKPNGTVSKSIPKWSV